jgi:hypothetical protein
VPVRETFLLFFIALYMKAAYALPGRKMAQVMAKTLNSQLASTASTPTTHVNSNPDDTIPPIEPIPLSLASADGHLIKGHTNLRPTSVEESREEKSHSFDVGEEDKARLEDENRQDDDLLDTRHSTDGVDEALFLDNDPANMSSWAGQPSVKGSSEVMRMMLLTFSSVGMTFVQTSPYQYQVNY